MSIDKIVINSRRLVIMAYFLLPNLTFGAETTDRQAFSCPTFSTAVERLGATLPDLGGSDVYDQDDPPVEAIGTTECPSFTAVRCDKLVYLSFIAGLLDMSPLTYRRPGIAALLANLTAESAGLGNQCSAESLIYSEKAIMSNFQKFIHSDFCMSTGRSYNEAHEAGIADGDHCNISTSTLDRMKAILIKDNPDLTKTYPWYTQKYSAIVARIYRDKFKMNDDTEGIAYRGRGFIQVTGKENYQNCQTDIDLAKQYLRANPSVVRRLKQITRLDWTRISLMQNPQLMSSNTFVASFCSASYWNRRVAASELVWDKDGSKRTFARIVSQINPDPSKIPLREKDFNSNCQDLNCGKNYPKQLNYTVGFSALLSAEKSFAMRNGQK